MRKTKLISILTLLFLSKNILAQEKMLPPPPKRLKCNCWCCCFVPAFPPKNILALEFEGYPAGQMYGVRFEHHWGKFNQQEINFRLAYNRAFRYNWSGLNDDEQGGGFGFSTGYRYHFLHIHGVNLFVGARTDIWQMSIFWKDYNHLPQKGTTHITVLQPSAEVGFRLLVSNTISATFYGGIGQEINIATKGKEVGQGGMYIWGATLGYTIN